MKLKSRCLHVKFQMLVCAVDEEVRNRFDLLNRSTVNSGLRINRRTISFDLRETIVSDLATKLKGGSFR